MGTGEDAARLHQPDYSFPDDIIETGVDIFGAMLTELIKPHDALKQTVATTSSSAR